MKKSLPEQAAAATLHNQAARRLRCIRCGEHPRQPPWRLCAGCKSRDASRAAGLGWRRRHRFLAQRAREHVESMAGQAGDLARRIGAAHDIEELTVLRAIAIAVEGRAHAAGDRDEILAAAEVRRFADRRIFDLRRALFGYRSTPP